MPDCRFYLTPPFQHLLEGLGRYFGDPSREMNQAKSRILVTTVPLVHHDVFWFHARKGQGLGDCPIQGVPIERIPMQGLYPDDPAFSVGDHKADLVPKFITLVGLPLGNTFPMGLMNNVKLVRAGPCMLQQPIGSL